MIQTTIKSIRKIRFSQYRGDGVLTVFSGNDPQGVVFPILRLFTIAGVSAGGSRGNHAHRGCSQLVACLAGRAEVRIDDGTDTVVIELLSDGGGVLIPPLLWNSVLFEGPSTVVAVFCDESYDTADYVRDRDEYLRLKGLGPLPANK